MNASQREVFGIGGRALLWLPVCLAAWYLVAAAIGWLPTRLASSVLSGAAGRVTQVEVDHRTAAYTLMVEGPYRPTGSRDAEARVEVPTATYTFGVAIFAALAFATRGWRRPGRFALGLAVLLPLPAFGIAFDALRQLGATPELAALLGWKGATREAIALGYQVGALLLPTLQPVAAWLALFPDAWRGARPVE